MSHRNAIDAAKKILEREALLESDAEAIGGKEEMDMQGKKSYVPDEDSTDEIMDEEDEFDLDDMEESEDYEDEMSEEDEEELEEESDEEKMEEEEDYDEDEMKEHMAALFGGRKLSETFKKKAVTIFTTAVNEKVNKKAKRIHERYNKKYQRKVRSISEKLNRQVNSYLKYVVKEWANENKIALEQGIKNEITESFISDLKLLFTTHNISVPNEKYDILESAREEIKSLHSRLNAVIESNVELTSIVEDLERNNIIGNACDGLTFTEAERLRSLAENISANNLDDFEMKVSVIRESYFDDKKVIREDKIHGESEVINETSNPNMRRYLESISKTAPKK